MPISERLNPSFQAGSLSDPMGRFGWWPGTGPNRRHADSKSSADIINPRLFLLFRIAAVGMEIRNCKSHLSFAISNWLYSLNTSSMSRSVKLKKTRADQHLTE